MTARLAHVWRKPWKSIGGDLSPRDCFSYIGRVDDAVHPTHEVRPAGCSAPKDQKVVVEQTSGRQRHNIHGAIDLETGKTRMIEVTTVDALSTIALLMAIAYMYPSKRLIHVFLEPVT